MCVKLTEKLNDIRFHNTFILVNKISLIHTNEYNSSENE